MNILIITTAASQNLIELFRNQERNVVTVMTPEQLRNSGVPSSCDLIVIYVLASNTTYSGDIINLVETTAVPVILGYINYATNGLGATGNSALTMLGLATNAADPNGLNGNLVFKEHEIFTKNNLVLNSTFNAYGTSEYISTINGSSSLPSGAEILTQTSTNVYSSVFYPKNMLTLDQKRLKADIVFMGFLSPRTALTEIAKNVVLSTVEFLSVKPYRIKGSVKSSSQVPLQRSVYLLDQITMNLKAKTISDPTGEYEFLIRDNSPCVIICTPNTITNNAQIRYNIIPEERDDL